MRSVSREGVEEGERRAAAIEKWEWEVGDWRQRGREWAWANEAEGKCYIWLSYLE
jgi:hypothetical protein